MEKKAKVLFLSRGNATRSQMAGGILRTLAGDEFEPASSGIEVGEPDPLAVEVMSDIGIDISGEQPKSVNEVLKEHFGYVVTIADSTRNRAPVFPFTTHLSRWDVVDPAAAAGSRDERKQIFRRVRDQIGANIQRFLVENSKNHSEPPVWSRSAAS